MKEPGDSNPKSERNPKPEIRGDEPSLLSLCDGEFETKTDEESACDFFECAAS